MKRQSGILLPVSALPSKYGIGDFGQRGYEFINIIKRGGFKLWQILPLNPLGYGHSPYQPFSSFAIDELYFDLDTLIEEGLVEEIKPLNENQARVDYEAVSAYKHKILLEAFLLDKKNLDKRLKKFIKQNSWVLSWSLFMSLKRKNEMRSWNTWTKEDIAAIEKEMDYPQNDAQKYEIWVQMRLYEQWIKLKKYANCKGIRIIGDLPFYVGFDSCDAYSNQKSFLLDEETKEPSFIAGVPPDYFSETGQRWGNPIYDWDSFEKDNFSFLINRLKGNSKLYDIIRLDHFRAFDTYWKIPSSCPTAIEGEWVEAPGYKFFDKVKKEIKGLEIIAEDLGELRDEVLVLRDHYSFPGMNVIEFTFESAEYDSNFDNSKENMVTYIGTHDNDPFVGFASKMDEHTKNRWLDKLTRYEEESLLDKVIDYALDLPSKYTIISAQDVLGLDSSSRLNKPSIIDNDNWTWKLASFDELSLKTDSLASKNKKYHRL